MVTLYDRIGGEAAVFAAASLLYDKLLADPLLAPFFVALDMDALIRKQAAFLAWAFGAPERYQYRALDDAHRALVRERGLSDVHFDAVADHLATVLAELGVAPGMIDEVMALVEGTRHTVLG
ncbi:MAG: group 1 hemoglobin [Myxococcaceae bacterium]|nr:group 1 hemoglobin [Myxococcaceae bacterium]